MSDEPGIDAETLRELYSTAPSEFVAARNALVKERRQARDRAAATAIAALRKPSAVDVALNLVAAAEPDTIAAFLTAAGDVRDAQTAAAEGRSAASTRDALRELRARTAAVVASAGKAAAAAAISGSLTAPATARLGELVANEAAGEQLRAGHLGSGAVEAVDPFAGLNAGESSAPPRRAPATRPDPGARAAPARPDAKAEAKRRRLEEALDRAVAERESIRHDHDEADDQVRDAQAAVVAAEARRRDAQQELDGAEAARAKVAAQLERAEAAVTKAQDALDTG